MSIDLTTYQAVASVLFATGAAMAPIPKTTLFTILTECGLNAFTAADAFEQTVQDGHILVYPDNDFIRLSDTGKQLSDIVKNDISAALRQKNNRCLCNRSRKAACRIGYRMQHYTRG